MAGYGLITALSAALLLVLAARALWIMRRERADTARGTAPGTGYIEIDSSYYSGGGGGGHQSSFRVPKDPHEYAKGFVPRRKGK